MKLVYIWTLYKIQTFINTLYIQDIGQEWINFRKYRSVHVFCRSAWVAERLVLSTLDHAALLANPSQCGIHDFTTLHCTEHFLITLPSSSYIIEIIITFSFRTAMQWFYTYGTIFTLTVLTDALTHYYTYLKIWTCWFFFIYLKF